MVKVLLSILIFLTPIACVAQEFYPLTEEELLSITNEIKILQHTDSIRAEIIKEQDIKILKLEHVIELDSLEISYQNKTILALQENSKTVWYENRYLYFFYGIAVVLGSSWVVKNTLK
jgi:hypothetical protein